MSDLLTLKLSPTHAIIAILVFLAGGGGAVAASRRNSGRTREADPEAMELMVRDADENSVAIEDVVAIEYGVTDEADVSGDAIEYSVVVEVEAGAAVEVEAGAAVEIEAGVAADASA